MSRSQRTALRRLEFLLLTAGTLLLGICLFARVQGAFAMRASKTLTITPPTSSPPTPGHSATRSSHVMGRLEIPGISLTVPILSNYEASSLRKGVGYIPGTARPGGLGTLGLAGHRDTYFKPLRNIKRDMDIRVADETGVYHYQVDSTEIVTPDQTQVLAIRSVPELTLITCYPFTYIGAAPQRFIVHAHLLSALPDEK